MFCHRVWHFKVTEYWAGVSPSSTNCAKAEKQTFSPCFRWSFAFTLCLGRAPRKDIHHAPGQILSTPKGGMLRNGFEPFENLRTFFPTRWTDPEQTTSCQSHYYGVVGFVYMENSSGRKFFFGVIHSPFGSGTWVDVIRYAMRF